MAFKIHKHGISDHDCLAVAAYYNAHRHPASAAMCVFPQRGGFYIPFQHLPPHLQQISEDQRIKQVRWKNVDAPVCMVPYEQHTVPILVSYFNHFPFMPEEETLFYVSLCEVFGTANVKRYDAISSVLQSSPDTIASFMS